MMPDDGWADMDQGPALRGRRGRPRSDDGLLEMLLKMALDKNLKPWPAALKAASLLTTNDDYRESLARGLTRKLRKVKKSYESGAVQDLLDDDIVYLVSIIAEDRAWLGTLTIQEKPGPFLLPVSGLLRPILVRGPDEVRLSRDERIRLIVQKSPY